MSKDFGSVFSRRKSQKLSFLVRIWSNGGTVSHSALKSGYKITLELTYVHIIERDPGIPGLYPKPLHVFNVSQVIVPYSELYM